MCTGSNFLIFSNGLLAGVGTNLARIGFNGGLKCRFLAAVTRSNSTFFNGNVRLQHCSVY